MSGFGSEYMKGETGSGSGKPSSPPSFKKESGDFYHELGRIRSELIDRLSDDDVIDLLHYLWKMDVLNDEEMKTVEGMMTSKDRARCLIDTVMEKGERGRSLMVDYLKERHPDLYWTLDLTPTSARIKLGWTRPKLIDRLSDDDVIDLLHYLRKMDALNDQEMKTVEEKTTSKDRARCLIDTVMEKGEGASSLMIDYLTERHPDLCWTLGLTPTSAWIKLLWIGSELIDRLLDDDVDSLLHNLKKMDALNDDEMKTVEEKMTSKDRARCLIATVMEKGERESRLMVHYLTERHPELYSTLGLTPTSARIKYVNWMPRRGSLSGSSVSLEYINWMRQPRYLSGSSVSLEFPYAIKDHWVDSGSESMDDSDLEHVTNEIDGLSSSGSSGQRSLSDFELCDPLDERAGSMLDSPEVVPVQEKTPDPERTEFNLNATGNGSDDNITPVPRTGRVWNRIKSFFLKKQSFSTRQGRLSGAAYDDPHRRMPKSDSMLGRKNHIHEDGSDPDDEDDEVDEEEMHFKTHCEKCKATHQSPEYEKVTPMKISKWSFQVQLEGEGTYECSATGLVFEVSEQALVRYSVLSWFKFSEFLPDSWRPAGSVYDVDVADPSVLKFIHFPHSLCLDEPELELSFRVLHVKDCQPNIETTVDFTASHVKWRVSSLSLLAPIIPESQKMKHHALVLIYKELNKYHKNKFVFHVFLASNDDSEIQAINKQVLKSRKKCIKIYKPAACRLEEKFYHLTSEPERKIEPPKLEFVTEVLALKGFSEACFGERPPFRLFLMDPDCDEPLWSATINKDDWNGEKSNLSKIFRFLSKTFQGANSRQRVAAEGTSDLRSSPRLFLEHRLGACSISGASPSSTRSSPPATPSESQPAGHPTSSTTSSPPAPSRATPAAGHPTSSTTSSPPATSRATQAEGAEGELRRIRSEFVQRVSIPVIKGLLDDLWQQELLSTEDKDFVMEKGKIKTDMARCLIDMVIGKGEKASKEMIDSMKKRDNPLCITLGLISSPTASGAQF